MMTSNGELPLGAEMPAFELKDTVTGKAVSSSGFQGAPLVVAFLCNHCPYVKHIQSAFADFAAWCMTQNVKVAAISSNDPERYPDDSPQEMAKEAKKASYAFPYLFDETQEVAKAYGAVCTPDIYLFDSNGKLVYHGQFDDSRPNSGVAATGKDLRQAVLSLIEGRGPLPAQRPSAGCSIKWKPGNEPSYVSG